MWKAARGLGCNGEAHTTLAVRDLPPPQEYLIRMQSKERVMPAVPTERAWGEAVVRRWGRGDAPRRGTRSLKEGKEEAYSRTGGEPTGQDPSRLEWKEGKSVGRWAARLYQVLEVRLRFCCCLFICRFVLTAPCRKGNLLNGFLSVCF